MTDDLPEWFDEDAPEDYQEMKEKHLEDDGRANLKEFFVWLTIREWEEEDAENSEKAELIKDIRRRFIQAQEQEENYP